MHPNLLTEFVAMFGLAVAVVLVCHQIRLPAIVGLLLTGVLAGPHGLGLITDIHDVEVLAEIGVVSLLFTIGLEFSLSRLLSMRKALLVAGPIQVGVTVFLVGAVSLQLGQSPTSALFLGMLAGLSSTAIVLSLLESRSEVDTPAGRVSLGILIFQDLIIVPMMLVVPFLAGDRPSGSEIATGLLLPMAVVGIGLPILAKWIVPALLAMVTRAADRQLFLLTTVFFGLGVAWVSSMAGLSLALGAFLAGMVVAESPFAQRAFGSVLPLRDLLTSFFFISVGMMLDLSVVIARPLALLGAVLLLLAVKTLTATLAALAIGYSLRIAIMAGLTLAQLGEFTFILYQVGAKHGLLAEPVQQLVLGAAVVSMMLTPLLVAKASTIADWVVRLPLPEWLKRTGAGETDDDSHLSGHLLVIGYGLNGRNLARAARQASIPYHIIEMNYDTVRQEQAAGEPIAYGDATSEAVLEHAGVHGARVIVVAISDASATRRIVELARRMAPDAHLIARTRYVTEMEALHTLGADEVIPEEFETAVEIFSRVLHQYLVPSDQIASYEAELRADEYALLRRNRQPAGLSRMPAHLPGLDLAWLTIEPDCPLAGMSVADIALRQTFGVTLLAVRRGQETLTHPGGDTMLAAGDQLVLLGEREKVAQLRDRARAHS